MKFPLILLTVLLCWPIDSAAHVIEHTHDTPVVDVPTGACSVTSSRLGSARIEFNQQCGAIKPDCDPVPRGSWTCSSVRIGNGAPAGVGGPQNNPDQDISDPNPPNPPPNVPNGNNVETSIGGTYTGPGPGGVGWHDSFQQNGVCWINSSNFDHGIGGVRVNTPDGSKTVREIAAAQEAAGKPNRQAGDPIYNDVQCGNGPANNAGDEDRDQCPGRVDQGKAGCRTIGPKWDLDALFASAPVTPPDSTNAGLRAEAESVAAVGGWTRTGNSMIWDGPNRYNIATRQDSANLEYRVTVPTDGQYEFRMRSRAGTGTTPSEPPNDVWFRFGSLPWTKAFWPKSAGRGVWRTDVNGENANNHNDKGKHLLRADLDAGVHSIFISGRSNENEIDWIELVRIGDVPVSVPTVGLYEEGDLIALHWDSCPDYDDLQSMVAAREILDDYPQVDFTGTNGTITRAISCNFVAGSTALMRMMYPSGLDAFANLNATTQTRATEWQLTLSSGNKVWVAEGGPSDFTANVVRELENRGVTNLKNIHVVQHSHGWNENHTTRNNIEYVIDKTTYIRIEDGNSNNATPDYNLQGGTFKSRARSSRYGQEWAIAFAKANAGRKVDFSDTVELMYILGIPKSAAPTPAAFADRYF